MNLSGMVPDLWLSRILGPEFGGAEGGTMRAFAKAAVLAAAVMIGAHSPASASWTLRPIV